MDMKELENVLEGDFKDVRNALKFKLKENNVEIEELEQRQNNLNNKLRKAFASFGLSNCVSSIDRIDLLNNALRKLEELIEINSNLNNMIDIYKEEIAKNGKVAIGVNKSKEYEERIKTIQEEMAKNRKFIKILGTKKELKNEIEELHNNISQSMIVLSSEEHDKIKDVYIENGNIQRRLIKLNSDNDKIINYFKEMNIDLEIEDKSIYKYDDVIAKNLGVKKEELDNVENIDFIRGFIKENPEVLEEDWTWDEFDDIEKKQENIIQKNTTKNPEVLQEDKTLNEIDAVENPEVLDENEEVEVLDDDKSFENIANILGIPLNELLNKTYGEVEELTKDIYGEIPSNEVREQFAKICGISVEELLNMPLYEVIYKNRENQKTNKNSIDNEYKTAIVNHVDDPYNNLSYKEKLSKLSEEGPLTKTVDPYVDYELLQMQRMDKFKNENSIANKIKNSVNKVEEKINDNLQKENEVVQATKFDVDDLLTNYYGITKEELYSYNEEGVNNLVAGYFGEDSSQNMIMTDEEFIQKIANTLNITIDELNTMDINTINTIMYRINNEKKASMKDVVDTIKNTRLIKKIGKLSKELSNRLLEKVELGTVKAGDYDNLEIIEEQGMIR